MAIQKYVARGVDLDIRYPPGRKLIKRMSNTKTPLESSICQWSLNSNIRKPARCDGKRMLELDHCPDGISEAMWSHRVHARSVRAQASDQIIRGSMNDEIDYELTIEQWETLKALRMSATTLSALRRTVVEDLAALGLATICDTIAVMTPSGRKALIRGSSRLLDVAA
jgi:hypothetical protein